MKFFFDNNLSIRIAHALRELEGSGGQVMHLRDLFLSSISDVDWISKLGNDGDWIVLSCDRNILRNPHEKQAWKESGLTVFFIKENFKNLQFWDQSWMLIKRWPSIKKEAERNPKSTLFVLSLSGTKIEKITS